MKIKWIGISVLVCTAFLGSQNASAGEQGHYYPGIINIRDVAMPPKGFYYATYNPYLSSDVYMDASGDEVDQITKSGTFTKSVGAGRAQFDVTLTGTITADIDLEFEAFTSQHILMWITEHKILGADYGLYVAPSYGHVRLAASAEVSGAGTVTIGPLTKTVAGSTTIDVEGEKDGFGDMLVVPFWLGWHGAEYDAGLNYGFFAPTGAYDSEDAVNVGLGYWTHQVQAAFAYYPTILAPKATALVVQGTYGYHTEKDGFDLTPGQDIDLEYGISQYLHPQIEIGVSGFHHWQITDDKGADAPADPSVHDQTNGFAAQVSVWPVVHKFYISFRYAWEYGAEDHFDDEIATVNGVWVF